MPCGALKSKNVLAGSVILVIIMLTTMVMPCFATESVPVKFERFHNVLLAEDNKTNQLVVKSILEQIGINTIIAGDGKEAVELYKEHADNIDLVLMDLHMPVMNGYEAAEKIREVSAKVPIVAMTADVILGVREKCEQSGIYHYISKPFNPEQFIQTIKDIILENEPGIDTQTAMLDRQTGLMNMGGNEKLYNEVLKEYCNENQDTLERLDAAVRGKRYADAGQIVHKLKAVPEASVPKLNAFKFLNKLKECGYNDICVSINVSVVQLLNPDFPGRLLELINNMQVNPDNVCIEITESVFASDMETTRCKITRKKKSARPVKNSQGSTNSPGVVQDGMNLEI